MKLIVAVFAFLIELLLMCVTQEAIWLGVLIITIGIVCFAYRDIPTSNKIFQSLIIGYCILWGSAIVGLYFAQYAADLSDNYMKYVILTGIGLIMVIFGAYSVLRKLRCRHKISATFRGVGRIQAFHTFRYFPKFTFCYEDRRYSGTPWETYGSDKKIRKRYREGEKYDIYIDPGNPENFALHRGLGQTGRFLFVIFMGIACIFGAFQS